MNLTLGHPAGGRPHAAPVAGQGRRVGGVAVRALSTRRPYGRPRAAFDDDIDTPAALRVLRELERDESVAPGSKFESFLHLDHVLGLDLSSEIGRVRVLPAGAAELLEQRARGQAGMRLGSGRPASRRPGRARREGRRTAPTARPGPDARHPSAFHDRVF
ncbi:hypothetical protein [Nonomuraea dietziae]|uniref:hypothetical protein n=1 Tax=Nonomuraea dietziae TaxID=65515 RepID=UPI0031DA9C35